MKNENKVKHLYIIYKLITIGCYNMVTIIFKFYNFIILRHPILN